MEKKIQNELSKIINPYTEEMDILNYVNKIEYSLADNKVILNLKPFGEEETLNKQISREIIKLLKIDMKILGVKIVNEQTVEEQDTFKDTKIIAIMSAKGGVGKSNVAYNIANILAEENKKVALVDADILGYSVSKLSNNYEELYVEEGQILPNKLENGLEVMSTEYFLPDKKNRAVVWRGNMFGSLLNKFFKETKYQEGLEYLVIDMPPGTSDTLLNLNNYFENINSVVVTTPSSDAHYVSQRIVGVLQDLGHNILGVINNMAYYEMDNEKHYILGQEDIKKYCEDNELKFLGNIPIKGESKYFEKSYLKKYYKSIVEQIKREVKN